MVYNPESRALTMDEMTVNAEYILSYLLGKGWTKNAVCGILGNMQSESSINPARWQSDVIGDMSAGFGLVQWTPASKYIDWANGLGYPYREMDSNLKRIEYEVSNNVQWINSADPKNRSFLQFTQSNDSAYDLAMAFISAYERPANPNQPVRGTQADYWFTHLSGSGTTGYQLAKFPMDMINITQGENGSYSHKGTWNIDFVGTTAQYPYYAPCDCECIVRSDSSAYLIWKSDKAVMCADGVIRNIVFVNMHENPLSHIVGDKLKKGDLMGHTGIGGNVTGDHWHFQVIEGSTYNGFENVPDPRLIGTQLHIYDVFAVNGVNIVNGLGYAWKTSTYVDGTPGVLPGNNKNKVIAMLLADVLSGWK